jgi:hypothetical protein
MSFVAVAAAMLAVAVLAAPNIHFHHQMCHQDMKRNCNYVFADYCTYHNISPVH